MVAISEQGEKVITFRGEQAVELFSCIQGTRKAAREYLIEGAAGTGKTFCDLTFVKEYCERWANSQWVLLRNERVAMNETILKEWEDWVLGPDHYVLRKGPTRENRDKYTFANGSTVILRGFDNEQKLFSGQYHGVLFNEATELKSEEKWETLHRALRAPMKFGQPFRTLIAEVNPRNKGHWLNRRAHAGRMKRIRTFLHENARWFDVEKNDWTDDGRDYIGAMSAGLTGVNRTRLLLGQWENNTGSVLPQFDEAVHVIPARLERKMGTWLLHVTGWTQPVELRWFFAAMDCGFQNAAVFGVWGMDVQGRLFEVCEIYRHHWTHEEWSQAIVKLASEFPLQGIACDHDAALIKAINIALVRAGKSAAARPADKTLGRSDHKGDVARLELLRSLLHRRGIFWVKGCNREIDLALKAKANMPWNTVMELPELQHEETVFGDDDVAKAEKIDKSFPNHGFDMTRYAVAFAATRNLAAEGLNRVTTRWEDFWDYDAKKRRKAEAA